MEKNIIQYQKPLPYWSDLEEADRPAPQEVFPCYVGVPPASYGAISFGRGIKVVMTHQGHEEPVLGTYFPVTKVYGLAGQAWRGNVGQAERELLRLQAQHTHDDSLIATAVELADVLAEINNLAFQDETDEFGLLRPSFHAFRTCLKFVLSLVQEVELLRPSEISTDRNGDIRITWTAEDREAELVFPSDDNSPPYLYHSSPVSYDTEFDLNPKSIAKMIRWAADGR